MYQNLGSPLFRVDIITKTNAGKLKKHLIHKDRTYALEMPKK